MDRKPKCRSTSSPGKAGITSSDPDRSVADMATRTFYLTTPIYYVNARPHAGHAGTTIMADAMCRYHRLAGERVYFLTGTDEHGDNIAQRAAKAAVEPLAYADEIAAAFRETWQRLGITNDDFIRTT